MLTALVQDSLQRFTEYMESALLKYEPKRTEGTQGSISGVRSYLKSYGENLLKFNDDIVSKANEILTDFVEQESGERDTLKNELQKAGLKMAGIFKQKYAS